jgi:hypothetical protein
MVKLDQPISPHATRAPAPEIKQMRSRRLAGDCLS